jgi:hypothetical protein
MENASKQIQSAQGGEFESNDLVGGVAMRQPPLFGFDEGGGGQSSGRNARYAEYEQAHAEMAFQDLIAEMPGLGLGFLGGLRAYLLAGEGLTAPAGRMLAAVEAVVGQAFSPLAAAWMESASAADQTAMRALTGSNFDWSLAETTPQGTMAATVPSTAAENLDPAFVARKQVFHELWLFEMSKLVQGWAEPKVNEKTQTAHFTSAALQADEALSGQMQASSDAMITAEFEHANDEGNWQLTQMRTEYATVQMDWVLRFMVYHALLEAPVGASSKYTYHAGGGDAGATFDGAHAEMAALNGDIDTRLNARMPGNGLFESTVIAPERSSDEESSEAARSFAATTMPLFERIRQIDEVDGPNLSIAHKLGTYDNHNWGQFSADVYLVSGINETAGTDGIGFWMFSTTMRFFDALAAAAEMDETASGGAGKFAWSALYNHQAVVDEVNERYGPNRIAMAEGHGPGKATLHIHLDIRPMDLAPDSATGFGINTNGRVEIPDA